MIIQVQTPQAMEEKGFPVIYIDTCNLLNNFQQPLSNLFTMCTKPLVCTHYSINKKRTILGNQCNYCSSNIAIF